MEMGCGVGSALVFDSILVFSNLLCRRSQIFHGEWSETWKSESGRKKEKSVDTSQLYQ